MKKVEDIEADYENIQETSELESIAEFENKKLSIFMKIIIWFIIFTLTFWSVAWFYG